MYSLTLLMKGWSQFKNFKDIYKGKFSVKSNKELIVINGSKQLIKSNHYTLEEYINTYHSRFIPEDLAETSQIFLQDTQILSKWFSCEK
jgi:hypothetical protein